MRSKKYRGFDGESSSYDLSISDLMAALCCVFVLFTIGMTTSLKEKNLEANQYNETKVLIADEIESALANLKLENKLNDDDYTFNRDKLILRFSGEKAAFEQNDSRLKESFQTILDAVFPTLMKTLYNSEKREYIEEVRIQGFTATDASDQSRGDPKYIHQDYINWKLNNIPKDKIIEPELYTKVFKELGEGKDHDYITGFTISQQRTMNVLSYCMRHYIGTENDEEKNWVRKHISASGYSLTHPIDENGNDVSIDDEIYKYDRNGKITDSTTIQEKKKAIKDATRRVEFRIKTDADKVVESFASKKKRGEEDSK